MSYFNKPVILMFLGVPGSGKSYFAKGIADKLNGIRINGDSMRLAMFGSLEEIDRIYQTEDRRKLNEYVFGGLDYVAEQILSRGCDVVYDAHQNKRVDRETVEAIAQRQNAIPIVVRVSTPEQLAFERTQTREAQIDQRQMSPERARDAIERHNASTDHPVPSENVVDIDGQQSFKEQFLIFEDYVKGIISGQTSQARPN